MTTENQKAEAVRTDFEPRGVSTSHGREEDGDAAKEEAKKEDDYWDDKPQVAALGRRNREYIHRGLQRVRRAQPIGSRLSCGHLARGAQYS